MVCRIITMEHDEFTNVWIEGVKRFMSKKADSIDVREKGFYKQV
jgi:hypothetical protein